MQINTLITAFRKSVCTTVSVTMLFAPTWAMGTDTNMKAIGREAQSFATEQAGDIKANPPALVGNELGVSGFLCLGRLFQGQPNEAALCI